MTASSDAHDSQPNPEQDSPSKSQRRREALAVLEFASELATLKRSALAKLPITSDTIDALLAIDQIKARVARKRQLHYAAKRLRLEDIDAVRAAMIEPGPHQARQLRLEQWSDHLRNQGMPAVEQLLALAPGCDRQTLRQAILATQRLSDDEREIKGRAIIMKALSHLPDEVKLPAPPTD